MLCGFGYFGKTTMDILFGMILGSLSISLIPVTVSHGLRYGSGISPLMILTVLGIPIFARF